MLDNGGLRRRGRRQSEHLAPPRAQGIDHYRRGHHGDTPIAAGGEVFCQDVGSPMKGHAPQNLYDGSGGERKAFGDVTNSWKFVSTKNKAGELGVETFKRYLVSN